MFESVQNVFRIPDLRKRIFFVLMLLAIYRVGSFVPVPGVDPGALSDFVEEMSDGLIAYVHIRSMNQASLRIFENEIDRFWNAKGIVIDIRYNGGGNIDQQLLDILERKPYEYWNNRWGGRSSGRRPRQTIAGPQVMLIHRRSGSDSSQTRVMSVRGGSSGATSALVRRRTKGRIRWRRSPRTST